MNKKLLLALIGSVLLSGPLQAEEAVKGENEKTKIVEPAKPAADESQVGKLAKKYNVTEEQVRTMRTGGKGMGWGEIGHALAIAQASGKPLAEILAARESGMGWGEIAKKYDLKLGDLKGKINSIEKEGKAAQKSDERTAAKAARAAGKEHGKSAGGTAHQPSNAHSHGNSKK